MFKVVIASLLLSFPTLAQANRVGCTGIEKSDLGFSTSCVLDLNAEPRNYLFSLSTFSNSKEAQEFCSQQTATPYLVDDAVFYAKIWIIRPTADLVQHLNTSVISLGEGRGEFLIMWNPPNATDLGMVEQLLNNPVELAKFEKQSGLKLTEEMPYLMLTAYDMSSGNSRGTTVMGLERDQMIAPGFKLPAVCTSSN